MTSAHYEASSEHQVALRSKKLLLRYALVTSAVISGFGVYFLLCEIKPKSHFTAAHKSSGSGGRLVKALALDTVKTFPTFPIYGDEPPFEDFWRLTLSLSVHFSTFEAAI